jgi:hypothetical protein
MTYGKQHESTGTIFLLYNHGKTGTILNYKSTFDLIEDRKVQA